MNNNSNWIFINLHFAQEHWQPRQENKTTKTPEARNVNTYKAVKVVVISKDFKVET